MKELLIDLAEAARKLYELIQEGNAGLQASNALMKIEQAKKLLEDHQVVEFRKLQTGRSFFIDQPIVTPETEVKVPPRFKELLAESENKNNTFKFRNTFEELQEAEVVEDAPEEDAPVAEETPKKTTRRKKA
jgi:hypothetical protein